MGSASFCSQNHPCEVDVGPPKLVDNMMLPSRSDWEIHAWLLRDTKRQSAQQWRQLVDRLEPGDYGAPGSSQIHSGGWRIMAIIGSHSKWFEMAVAPLRNFGFLSRWIPEDATAERSSPKRPRFGPAGSGWQQPQGRVFRYPVFLKSHASERGSDVFSHSDVKSGRLLRESSCCKFTASGVFSI